MKKSAQKTPDTPATLQGLAALVVREFSRVNTRMDKSDEALEKLAVVVESEFQRVDERFDAVETRFDSLDEQLRAIRRDLFEIDKRLTVLEESVRDIRGYAKEIDSLRAEFKVFESRLARLEKTRGR